MYGGWRSVDCCTCYATVNPVLCLSHLVPLHWLLRFGLLLTVLILFILYLLARANRI